MELNANQIYAQNDISTFINIIKNICILLFTYYTNFKISNKKLQVNFKNVFAVTIIIIFCVLSETMNKHINVFLYIIGTSLMISLIFSIEKIGKSILTTIISLSINYSIFAFSIILSFVFNKMLSINDDKINLIIIVLCHLLILHTIFRMKRFKYGISVLKGDKQSKYLDVLILNISVIILFVSTILSGTNIDLVYDVMAGLILFAIIMFITIQKSLQLYYKQKLLEQELNKTKEELANKSKEIENLEAENIEISKKAHTLTHKQKSLAHKIDEMVMSAEISKEEAAAVRERLNEIGKELYKEKNTTELTSTEIPEIDDMLKYMQSECSANKIDFDLQLKGNIHYMINNLITKQDLETLLADHIKNAIIAINHTDNVNRSILVKLGKIDETYGLYIYDSGIEFEKETLENLGKKPSTTHKDEGGTGMGFMNTFDTLRKCNASLVIEEFNKPDKDNYTKVIMTKFDNKNEFKIKSYRENEVNKK